MADHSAHDTPAAHGDEEGTPFRSPHPHSDLPHVGLGTFIKVFVALLVLTLISFGTANARFLDDAPSVKWVIMMAVSCAKALLVISFFMHLLWEANWKYVLTIPASVMSILLMLLLVPDIGRRTRNYSEERWRHAAVPESKERRAEGIEPEGAASGKPTAASKRNKKKITAREAQSAVSTNLNPTQPDPSRLGSPLSALCSLLVQNLSYSYGAREALRDVSFSVPRGQIFAFLGPNGGGKSTLFRLLATLVPLQKGRVTILGHDLQRETLEIRRHIGVVFQSPSLDRKLTVRENLQHQAALYGLSRASARERIGALVEQVGLVDRLQDYVESLSGGMRRRVELAKAMLHHPQLLLMDEPSTGLDPGARIDLWNYLEQLRSQAGVTIALTTHLLEEADRADTVAILDEGRLVALDSPQALRTSLGGDTITIETARPEELARAVASRFQLEPRVLAGSVRLEQPRGHEWITRLVDAFPDQIQTVTVGKPTLEDVFIAKTGHRL